MLVDGKTLYLAGQMGVDLNGTIVLGGIEAETRQTLQNMGHILRAAGANFTDGWSNKYHRVSFVRWRGDAVTISTCLVFLDIFIVSCYHQIHHVASQV